MSRSIPVYPIEQAIVPIGDLVSKVHQLREHSIWPNTEAPWIPIGFIGYIPIFAHYKAESTDFWDLPIGLFFRNLISENAYFEYLSKLEISYDVSAKKALSDSVWNHHQIAQYVFDKELFKLDSNADPTSLEPTITEVQSSPILRFLQETHKKGIQAIPNYKIKISEDLTGLIPTSISEEYKALCFFKSENTLYTTIGLDQETYKLEDALNKIHEFEVFHPLCTARVYQDDFTSILYESNAHLSEDIGNTSKEKTQIIERVKPLECDELYVSKFESLMNKSPRNVLAFLIVNAIKAKATDIHIQEDKDSLHVKYRINTNLFDKYSFNKSVLPKLNSIINQYANLNRHEKNYPQSGKFLAIYNHQPYEIRVSMMPMAEDQSTVLRIHAPHINIKTLDKIGLNPKDYCVFTESLSRSSGIILVTGPTGSGKTTSLYAALEYLNDGNTSIQTIEDPIEKRLEGIKQFQVEPKIELTFSRLFREVLRHDPDVVMLGELRDKESALQAIIASQTGHLVLSTLHTQDSFGVIPRLLSEGINPEPLSDALLLIQAQRLVGTLCNNCKSPLDKKSLAYEELLREFSNNDIFAQSGSPTLFTAGKCEMCNETGYGGKHAIFEFLPINDAIRDLIASKSPLNTIKQASLEVGFRSLYQESLQQVALGKTAYKEAMKYKKVQSFDFDKLKIRMKESYENAF